MPLTAAQIHAQHVAHVEAKNAKAISSADSAPPASQVSTQDIVTNIASIVDMVASLGSAVYPDPRVDGILTEVSRIAKIVEALQKTPPPAVTVPTPNVVG